MSRGLKKSKKEQSLSKKLKREEGGSIKVGGNSAFRTSAQTQAKRMRKTSRGKGECSYL